MADQEKKTQEQDVQDKDTQEFETVDETTQEQSKVEVVSADEATPICADFLRKHLGKEYEAEDQEVPDESSWKWRLDEAITKLYSAYEAGGDPPCLEALVTSLRSQPDELSHHMADVLEMMKRDPFLPRKKKKLVIGIIIAVVVLALIGGGAAYAFLSQQQQEEENVGAVTEAVKVETVEQEGVSVNVTCEGWNADTSTPIVLAIYEGDVKDTLLSTDENVEVPEALNEVSVNAGEDTKLEDIVDAGTYTLSIVGSPVLEDGTIFDVPDPQVIEYDGEKGQIVKFELTKKDASEVTEADIAAASAAASAVGADTTKVENATNNTRNAASSAQGGTIQQGQSTAQSKPSKPSGGSTSGGSANTGNSGSTSGGSSTGGGSTSGGNSGGGSSQPSQPTHTHNWVPQYTTKEVPVYDTVTVIICDTCGAENPSRDHMYQHAINGENDATHNEYRKVIVGYDKQQVLTGYVCSGCGATKQ